MNYRKILLAFVTLLVVAMVVILVLRPTPQTETVTDTESTPAVAATEAATEEKADSIPAPDNVAAVPGDAIVTESGLAYVVLTDAPGTQHPTVDDNVTVHYTGWQTDGKMFDSSVLRGEPATFPLGRLIAGWIEGIQLMTPGDSYRFWIPEELAYGKSTRVGAPKGMLVFDIELIDIPEAESESEE